MKHCFVALSLGLVLMSSFALAAPKPAVVQGPGLWTAKVTYEPLRPMMYQPNAATKPRRFWYSIVTIENPTREDVRFFPKFDLVTDTIEVIPAGKAVPQAVYRQLLNSYRQGKYPLLQSIDNLTHQLAKSKNVLRRGSDHAVDVLAVWPDFDPKASQVNLYLTGLSNETAVVKLPSNATAKPVYLRKSLELSFDLQSESGLRNDVDAIFNNLQWVMR